jgi:hypothetical protein
VSADPAARPLDLAVGGPPLGPRCPGDICAHWRVPGWPRRTGQWIPRSRCLSGTRSKRAGRVPPGYPAAQFALEVRLLALHWLAKGYGYEITGADVWAAYSTSMAAAERIGDVNQARGRIRQLVASDAPAGFVAASLAGRL